MRGLFLSKESFACEIAQTVQTFFFLPLEVSGRQVMLKKVL